MATYRSYLEHHKLTSLWATDLMVIPSWNTAGRPTGTDLQANLIGINTDISTIPIIEWYDGTTWRQPGTGTSDGNNYSTGVTFTSGILSIQRDGLSDISVSLDGRYLQAEADPIFTASFVSGITSLGSGLSLSSGILSSTITEYTLPIASETVLGGIKVGSGLSIDGTGVMSTTSQDWSVITSKPNSGNFIYNQNNSAQTGANFWIDGSGAIGGLLQFTDGTNTVYAYRQTSSSNFIIETNSIANIIYANGSNGYIGLRTASPQYNLDVNGTGRFSGNLTLAGSLGTATIHSIGGSSAVSSEVSGSYALSLYDYDPSAAAYVFTVDRISGNVFIKNMTNASTDPDKMVVNDGGHLRYMTKSQLGIGNVAIPANQLAYGTGTGITSSSLLQFDYNTFGDGYYSLNHTNASGNAHFSASSVNGRISFNWDHLGKTGSIYVLADNGMTFHSITPGSGNAGYVWLSGGAATEVMRLGGDGKLLLGYTSSQGSYQLQVNGTGCFSGYSDLGGAQSFNGQIVLGNTPAYQGVLQYNALGSTTFSIDNTYADNNAAIQFRLATAGTPVTALKLLGDGSALVGYTSSQGAYKLQVNGKAYFSDNVVVSATKRVELGYIGLGYASAISGSGCALIFPSTNGGFDNPGGYILGGASGIWGNQITLWARDAAGSSMKQIMAIDGEGTGSVLIGYTSSQGAYKLQVNGAAYINSGTTNPLVIKGVASNVFVTLDDGTAFLDIYSQGSAAGFQTNGNFAVYGKAYGNKGTSTWDHLMFLVPYAGLNDGTGVAKMVTVNNGVLGYQAIPSTPPAGSNTQVQFNNSGAFGASSNLTWSSNQLGVTGQVVINNTATGSSTGVSGNYAYVTHNFNGNTSAAGAVFASNVQFFQANINATQSLSGASIFTGLSNILRIGSSNTAAGTYAATTSSSTRAMSANGCMVQLSTLNNSSVVVSIDNVAGLQIFAPQAADGSGVASNQLASITNYYGILLAASDEYSSSGAKITNKYGIYQAGVNDMNIFASKNSSFGSTSAATSAIDITGSFGYKQLRLRTQYTPSSSSDTNGNTGDTAVDDNYFYYKTNAGWKRAALSTF